jgi:hypothetical protein
MSVRSIFSYKKAFLMAFSNIRSRLFTNPINSIKAALGIKEILILGGLSMLGYGLWLYIPWVSFVVCGVLLMLLGLCIRTE